MGASTSKQDRRLCGPRISPVVPEREFFNRTGRSATAVFRDFNDKAKQYVQPLAESLGTDILAALAT